jgi:hypothetical protein
MVAAVSAFTLVSGAGVASGASNVTYTPFDYKGNQYVYAFEKGFAVKPPINANPVDVPETNQFRNDIIWLYGEDITYGCVGGEKEKNSKKDSERLYRFTHATDSASKELVKTLNNDSIAADSQAYENAVATAKQALEKSIQDIIKQYPTPTYDFTYCPTGIVSRGEMAAFLHRFAQNLGIGNDISSTTKECDFVDVTGNYAQFATDICWLRLAKITTGVDKTHYQPAEPVSRSQMAAFLHRLVGSPQEGASGGCDFVDVTGDHAQFATDIYWLKHVKVTTGVDKTHYQPAEPVSRSQMAAFLHRLHTWTSTTVDAD